MKWALPAFCLFFCAASLYAQDVLQDQLSLQQTSLSSAVRSALLESKQSMESLEQSYQAMINSLSVKLDAQSEESARLSAHLTDTMNSFRALSAALENSNYQLGQEKAKAGIRNTVLICAGVLFLANVLAKIGAFICWGRGIKLPRWLDILI